MNFGGIKITDDIDKRECTSRISQNEWNGDICEYVESENDDYGTITGICICKSLYPTSIFNDLSDILLNSNLNDAFSNEGLETFLKFKFWESYIFYIYML